MGLWRELLRVLGLSSDARVHISAPGIDVVITGEPEQVRALLLVVKHELERNARRRDRGSVADRPVDGKIRAQKRNGSGRLPPSQSIEQKRPPALTPSRQYVQPSELDEMDSPYALPDPLVMPVEEPTDETEAQRSGEREKTNKTSGYAGELATLVPEPDTREKVPVVGKSAPLPTHSTGPIAPVNERPALERDVSPGSEIGSTNLDATPVPLGIGRVISTTPTPHRVTPVREETSLESSIEEGEREVTHVTANPSGPTPTPPTNPPPPPAVPQPPPSGSAPAILRNSSPFVTDGGPTLTPLADSDPGGKIIPKKTTNPPPLPTSSDPRDLRTLDSDIEDTSTPSPGRG